MKLRYPILWLVLLCFVRGEATAQTTSARRPRRVPVTVVLVDSLAQREAPFVIVRRPGNTPADLILLRDGGDVNQLSDAIRGLLTARLANGDVAPSAATFRVRPQAHRGAAARAPFPWATRVLNDLRHATPREIRGFGCARSVEIWLPRQGVGRAKSRA